MPRLTYGKEKRIIIMNKHLADYNDVLTVKDIMEILNIGKNTAYNLIKTNQIDVLRIGKQIRIPKRNLMKYMYNERNLCYDNE